MILATRTRVPNTPVTACRNQTHPWRQLQSPSPQTASPTFFGLTVLNYQNVTPQLTYGTAQDMGRTWPTVGWAQANPAAEQYNFNRAEYLYRYERSGNRQDCLHLGHTPQWASTTP